ncbi:MAG: sulfite exporter TauE/SafE family protein [Bacteroidia bacterium]
MDLFLWSALTLGFFGSFHCAGMCGPIAMALPNRDQQMTSLFVSRLLYNVGRVTTYSIFGVLAGLFGHSLSINGWQSDISILSGIIIILFVLFNTQAVQTKINHRLYKFTTYLKKSLGAIMQKKSFASLYFIGVLNGFLPCGFVYLALAGAASSHGVLEGMSYMALFGLGTIPMMLVLSLSGSFISIKARNWVQKASPVVAIVLALFLIQRGVMLKENPDACCERVEKSDSIR